MGGQNPAYLVALGFAGFRGRHLFTIKPFGTLLQVSDLPTLVKAVPNAAL